MLRRTKCLERIIMAFFACGLVFLITWLSVTITGDEKKPLPVSDDLHKLLIQAEAENSRRKWTVQNVCKKYNLGIYRNADKASKYKQLPAPQYGVFYNSRAHNVSYCPIYKAGSTTWLYNLCLLEGVTEEVLNISKEQISTIARRAMPQLEYPKADEVLQSTARMLVVRHPFERLLSAYRDKLENSVTGREHGTLHFYRKYGAHIVQKYRGKQPIKPRPNQVIRQNNVFPPAGIEPTWREFVDYLINTDLPSYADDHWMPYYFYCTPCLVKYDLIAKVESLWRDQVYAIKELGWERKIQPRWRHGIGQTNASRIYFSQLNKSMVQKLYHKFKLDFELFGYSPNAYYKYATSLV